MAESPKRTPERSPKRARNRLIWSSALALGGVVAATAMMPSYGGSGDDRAQSLISAYEKVSTGKVAAAKRAKDPLDSALDHTRSHNDPATKNAISRTGESGESGRTADPTTSEQAAANAAAVAAQRAEPDPELVHIAKASERRSNPQNRYVMAGGCYALRGDAGWVVKDGGQYAATADSRSDAEPFRFQATDLGSYLLLDSADELLATGGGLPLTPSITAADEPGPKADWKVRNPGSRFTFTQGETQLTSGDPLAGGNGTSFKLRLTSGCAMFPEISTNISGRTFAGVSDIQEVRGTVDSHTHGMAFEFLGGDAHCGRPWSPYGVTVALQDCADHQVANGCAAILETALSSNPCHDPVGWPTFKNWPAPASLTHEGTYYKWMERAWEGGLRIFTNLLVENNQLCTLYPIKHNSCDDMDSIRLQAKDMRLFERYIDAQYGGPGKGWYRIVRSPFEARRVINDGKLAVIMGIETSIPFGCTIKSDVPKCSKESIDASLAEVRELGVRQMELLNKFDNALAGVAGDSGETGVLVNSANFLETESFWNMQLCDNPDAEDGVHDREQYAAPGIDPQQQDALFGAVYEAAGGTVLAPAYPPAPHCNNRGLTDLGRYLIRKLVKKHMVFDPDHMSVKARKSSLNLVEKLDYPGVLSSHSWSTPDAYPRIYKLGGFITPYAGDSTGFVSKWRQHLKWADKRYYFGFGYGADINGLGAQGDPRPDAADNPVTYPFTGMGGVKVKQQRSGERVYDINTDGVAHYGLYPDWFQDLEQIAGERITDDMSRGAEAYLQMWERARGVSNDACREPSVAKRASLIRGLERGLTAQQVLKRAGQPHERLGNRFTYCAKVPSGGLTRVSLRFTDGGRLT